MALKNEQSKDFFVMYLEENDDLAESFTEHFVNRWEKEYNLNGIYHRRDVVYGKTIFGALESNIKRSTVVVIVLTEKFLECRQKTFAGDLALVQKIKDDKSYLPIALGLEEEKIPFTLKDNIYIAKFPEHDWENETQVWDQLDNVLFINELISEETAKRTGKLKQFTAQKYHEKVAHVLSDKFLKDNIAGFVSREYVGLGIELGLNHHRLDHIREVHRDPQVYNFKMLVSWRDMLLKENGDEEEMVEMLKNALENEGRNDLREIVRVHAEQVYRERQVAADNVRKANTEEEDTIPKRKIELDQHTDIDEHQDELVYDRRKIISQSEADFVKVPNYKMAPSPTSGNSDGSHNKNLDTTVQPSGFIDLNPPSYSSIHFSESSPPQILLGDTPNVSEEGASRQQQKTDLEIDGPPSDDEQSSNAILDISKQGPEIIQSKPERIQSEEEQGLSSVKLDSGELVSPDAPVTLNPVKNEQPNRSMDTSSGVERKEKDDNDNSSGSSFSLESVPTWTIPLVIALSVSATLLICRRLSR